MQFSSSSFSFSLLLFIISLFFLNSFSLVSGQTPIPTRPDGYGLGISTAPVVLEAFYDLLCPDSKATWPVIQQVIDHYGRNLYFIFHTFPLPYHTFAFIANQGMHVVDHVTNHSINAVYSYASLIFAQQSMWYNAPTINMSSTDIIHSIAKVVAGQGIIDQQTFINGIADVDINSETRVSWKYGCSRGQVTGTPTFLINGVYVTSSPSFNLTQWEMIIDPILTANGITVPPSLDEILNGNGNIYEGEGGIDSAKMR